MKKYPLYPLRLIPIPTAKIWGGTKLSARYAKPLPDKADKEDVYKRQMQCRTMNVFISKCPYRRTSLLAKSVVRFPLTYLQAKSLLANIFARYLVCARILSLLVIYIIRLPYAGAISTAESETLFNLN